ncbi:dihydroxyacetone kinase family protein [Thalassospira sp. MCCC 1A01428]|uniref:dihydroxyacetone kinase family protein n=1 Tax=Thalassospira sp. MCCC 1A01428 TaxID=1470575 RepID=UPI000A1F8789|nr:dihydroxyacetone kinase family protein [Thalassospira sp. MCCC 1A01428]OSQ36703.1 dihydroxyacetone kinase [Thalassospira sp. MCCC 1A01428]
MSKKLINNPKNVVREMLEGVVDGSDELALLEHDNVVLQAGLPAPDERPVAIISGGGSGHEPAHAGYVGKGMLTGAVAGDVFTSPSTDAVLHAIRACAGPAGAVLVVKNYTGDRLNFGLAAELAQTEGIPVEIVVVADDVSLHQTVSEDRRRGIAGTVLIHKIAGAAAAAGKTLGEVADIARQAAGDLGSMGVALGACTLPGAKEAGFTLDKDEIELGLGIHGEKGVERRKIANADELCETILKTIITDRKITKSDRVALLVNGLGATSALELAIMARGAIAYLRENGIMVERVWNGTLLSALDMPGCSLSLLKLDDERAELLDAPTSTSTWPGQGRVSQKRHEIADPKGSSDDIAYPDAGLLAKQIETIAHAVAKKLKAEEPHLTDLDTKAGDGDLGASLERGADAILALPNKAWATPATALIATGNALRKAIAGSSGPFYANALIRAGRHLQDEATPNPAQWADAFETGAKAIAELGGAKEGDRTMLDALLPAAKAFNDATKAGKPAKEAWQAACDAARKGADSTADMTPELGRASYLGDRAVGVPDGGAVAVAIWMQEIADNL